VFVHNISVYDTYDNIASKDVPCWGACFTFLIALNNNLGVINISSLCGLHTLLLDVNVLFYC
jgi:hypothetical protein